VRRIKLGSIKDLPTKANEIAVLKDENRLRSVVEKTAFLGLGKRRKMTEMS
jgi:hypothetical protein